MALCRYIVQDWPQNLCASKNFMTAYFLLYIEIFCVITGNIPNCKLTASKNTNITHIQKGNRCLGQVITSALNTVKIDKNGYS